MDTKYYELGSFFILKKSWFLPHLIGNILLYIVIYFQLDIVIYFQLDVEETMIFLE
jgi:hypothetical protein